MLWLHSQGLSWVKARDQCKARGGWPLDTRARLSAFLFHYCKVQVSNAATRRSAFSVVMSAKSPCEISVSRGDGDRGPQRGTIFGACRMAHDSVGAHVHYRFCTFVMYRKCGWKDRELGGGLCTCTRLCCETEQVQPSVNIDWRVVRRVSDSDSQATVEALSILIESREDLRLFRISCNSDRI
jgi:hypothetical protein